MPDRLRDCRKRGLFVVDSVVRGLIVGQNRFNAHIFELLLELVESIHALNAHDILVELFRHIRLDLAHNVGVFRSGFRIKIQRGQKPGGICLAPQLGCSFLLGQGLQCEENFRIFHDRHLSEDAAGITGIGFIFAQPIGVVSNKVGKLVFAINHFIRLTLNTPVIKCSAFFTIVPIQPLHRLNDIFIGGTDRGAMGNHLTITTNSRMYFAIRSFGHRSGNQVIFGVV